VGSREAEAVGRKAVGVDGGVAGSPFDAVVTGLRKGRQDLVKSGVDVGSHSESVKLGSNQHRDQDNTG
jgi:hypothetical protein